MNSSLPAPAAWKDIIPRWRKYAAPAKPSADDVDRFRHRLEVYLRQFTETRPDPLADRAEVLVLGATPELRTLLATLPGIRVTLIDCVLPMLQAMTELVEADDLDEVWIRGDWLTAPLPTAYFDLVLSDLVLGNLPPEDQRRLVARIPQVLKPTGRWVSRVDCVDEFSVFEDLETLLAYYAEIDEPTAFDICSLRSVAGLRHWNPATGFLSYAELGEAMNRHWDGERYIHPNPRANHILTELREVTLPFGRPYWLSVKSRLDLGLTEHFTIVDEQRDDTKHEYPGRGYYVYDMAPLTASPAP